MAESELAARVAAVLAEEKANGPASWWYLSFADEDDFRGAAVVYAWGVVSAASEAHRLGINPGGQVVGVPVPADEMPPVHFLNRLLDLRELMESGMVDDPASIEELERAGVPRLEQDDG